MTTAVKPKGGGGHRFKPRPIDHGYSHPAWRDSHAPGPLLIIDCRGLNITAADLDGFSFTNTTKDTTK